MGVIITTAGFDKLGPCYQMRTMCTEVLMGMKKDDTLFAGIYSLDESDDSERRNHVGEEQPEFRCDCEDEVPQGTSSEGCKLAIGRGGHQNKEYKYVV